MHGKWYDDDERGGLGGRRWRPMRRDIEHMVGSFLEQIIEGLERAESGLRRASPGPYTGMGPRSQRSDEQIRADVEGAITDDGWVDGRAITVRVEKGVVTLEGSVATPEQKRRAGEDAWDTPGVVDVQNMLTIASQRPEANEDTISVD